MNWDKLKELVGIVVATSAIVLAVGAAYMEWRISVNVDEALTNKNFPSDATIATVNGKINVHATRIQGVEDRQDFTEEQLRDMANILMRRPESP